jgi:ketosteroid isomerase-like protein
MNHQAIKATLEDYANAYCAKDIEALMRVFDDTDDICVIGTGNEEICEGRASVKALFLNNFAEVTANKFSWQWININEYENSAIVGVMLTIHLEYQGERLDIPIRWLVALKKTDRWVWTHRHASSAASNQDEGQAYPQEQ